MKSKKDRGATSHLYHVRLLWSNCMFCHYESYFVSVGNYATPGDIDMSFRPVL